MPPSGTPATGRAAACERSPAAHIRDWTHVGGADLRALHQHGHITAFFSSLPVSAQTTARCWGQDLRSQWGGAATASPSSAHSGQRSPSPPPPHFAFLLPAEFLAHLKVIKIRAQEMQLSN